MTSFCVSPVDLPIVLVPCSPRGGWCLQQVHIPSQVCWSELRLMAINYVKKVHFFLFFFFFSVFKRAKVVTKSSLEKSCFYTSRSRVCGRGAQQP